MFLLLLAAGASGVRGGGGSYHFSFPCDVALLEREQTNIIQLFSKAVLHKLILIGQKIVFSFSN
jgi:hypothetical protein